MPEETLGVADLGTIFDKHARDLLWDKMMWLYRVYQPALSPARRASLLRALAGVHGLSVRGLVVDGVTLTAVRMTEGPSDEEILFDPSTGLAMGKRSLSFDDDLTIYQLEGGPILEPGVLEQKIWTQTVTNRLG